MKFIKLFITPLFILFLYCSSKAQNKITIDVYTNVNSFQCSVGGSSLKSTKTNNSKTIISVPVKDFKCPKEMMEKDLQKLFESNKYPYITLSIDHSKDNNKNLKTEIKIKNISKNYYFNFNQTDNYVLGKQIINLTDFKITPPTRLMGLVKVKDTVQINFKFDKNFL